MQEMVDKIEAINRIELRKQYTNSVHDKTLYDHCIADIEMLPTIEPEVRHGRWIEVTKHRDENGTILTDYECSECSAMVKDIGAEEIESERFCYNCGARMDATDTNVGGKGGDDNVSNV